MKHINIIVNIFTLRKRNLELCLQFTKKINDKLVEIASRQPEMYLDLGDAWKL